MDRRLLEYRPDIAAFESPVAMPDRQKESFAADEIRQAAELLERVDEGELEGYLVELIDGARRPPSQRVTEALAAILGRAARRLLRQTEALPARSKGRVFGIELEGLSSEDQAFELARHFVRFASEAARRASGQPGAGSPEDAAWRAASSAAQSLAPGLLPSLAGGSSTGAWFRRGRHVVVLKP